MPQVSLGLVTGTAGGTVTLPVGFIASQADVSAIANDIEYDSAQVDVAEVGGVPDCTIDARLAAAKQIHASVAALTGTHKRLRVGLIGANNNSVITSGPLYTCRFIVNEEAEGSIDLINTPQASSPQAVAVAVGGTDGRIDVTAAPAGIALGTGTAAAGGSAVVSASLHAAGNALAAVATDIQFDSASLSVGDNDGMPDCTLDPALGALGKELIARELPGSQGMSVLRVGVIGLTNNTALPDPDGTVALFQCRFAVQKTASGVLTLEHSPEGAAPNAQPVGLNGEPGSITVQ
jgi:hypothetical protein